MREPKLKNTAASIRQKLLNLAQKRNDDFGLILTKYGLERILFRLSKSKYRDAFILKGALLFEVWTKQRHRPTRDADFLAAGDSSPERFVHIFRELSVFEFPHDALRFDAKTVKAERIKENADYSGVRVTLTAFLENSRIPIQIDIAFGDKVTPGPLETVYPTLLDLPAPHILTYPRETVVSEKLEAIVKLGITNTRMKDFHDLHTLSTTFSFDGKILAEAIGATFKQRGTDFPESGVPIAFSSEFFADTNKVKQWRAFCHKNKSYVAQTDFVQIIARLSSFLVPPIRAIRAQDLFSRDWTPKNMWSENLSADQPNSLAGVHTRSTIADRKQR